MCSTPTDTRHVVLVEFITDTDGFGTLGSRRQDRDFSEVAVLAATESEAHLVAAQMVACRPGIQVTRTFPSC